MRSSTFSAFVPAALVSAAAVLLAAGFIPRTAVAEEPFPHRPITLVVPSQAGGGADIVFRKLAAAVKDSSGTSIIVVNKPGASATLATTYVVRSNPDGYTIGGIWNGPLTMAPLMVPVQYEPTSYDPILQVSSSPVVLCVHRDFPASNTKEFVNELRKHPDTYTYGTDGVGNTVQFSATRAFKALGVSARAVPFGSSGATVQGFLSGTIDIYGGSLIAIKGSMTAGTAKCLFITTAEDNPSIPQADGLTKLGVPKSAISIWYGLIAPKGLPPQVRTKLADIFRKASDMPEFKDFLGQIGMTLTVRDSRAMRKVIDEEFAANALIAKDLKLQP